MDMGCELHGYASDLTRTWPPCGKFSAAQVFYLCPISIHTEVIQAVLVCPKSDLNLFYIRFCEHESVSFGLTMLTTRLKQ